MRTSYLMIFATLVFAVFIFTTPSIAAPGEKEGKAIFEQRCAKCHGLDKATSKKKTEKEWLSTVERMKKKGASLNDEETRAVVEHLAKNYGKK